MPEPERWQQPGAGRRPEETEGEGFRPPSGSLVTCTLCGAVVDAAQRRLHSSWHRKQHHDRVPVTVHGLSSPSDDREPCRLFEVVSSFPQEESIEMLRDWAAQHGADLSFRQPGGFRATFNAHVMGWARAENLSVRLAVQAEPGPPRSCRLRVLIIPAGALGVTVLTHQTYDERFDQLEGEIRRLVERR